MNDLEWLLYSLHSSRRPSRRDLTDSMTELDNKSTLEGTHSESTQSLLRRLSGNLLLRSFTSLETREGGMGIDI
jgi:hypothetical protein